jgi:hypothetical protein
MNEQLLKLCTVEVVSLVMAQMGGLNAPGPDGLSAGFFHDHWSMIGHEVCSFVLDFFLSGIIENAVNFTHIALIPKIANPLKVSNLRPISLCNVFYKTISKTLVNRLMNILHEIISDKQSAFIPGRCIGGL